MADTVTKKIQIDTNQATANVDKLSKALDKASDSAEELNGSLNGVKETTEQPINTKGIDKLGQSMDKAADDAEQLRVNTDNIQKVSAGLQGAFAMAVGAMALFGNESEAVTRIMQKLAAVMVITNGLKAIGEGVAAMKALRAATDVATVAQKKFNLEIIKNPYTAIAAAVLALGVAVYKLTERHREGEKVAKAYREEQEKIRQAVSDEETALNREIKLMESQGASYEEMYKKRKKFYENEEYEANREKNRLQTRRDLNGKLTEDEQRQLDEAIDRYTKYYNLRQDLETDYQVWRNNASNKAMEDEAKAAADAAKAEEERNKQVRDTAAEERKRKAIAELTEQEKMLAEWTRYYVDALLAEREATDELMAPTETWLEEKKREFDTLSRILDIRRQLADVEDPFDPDAEAESFDDQLTSMDKASIGMTKLRVAQKQYFKDFQKDWEKMDIGEKMGFVTQQMGGFADALSGMFTAIMSGMDENSEAYKGLAITQTIIQTLVGMATALSGAFTTKSGPWDIALAAVQAASILAGGIATISQIASANEDTNLGSASSTIASSSQVSENAVQGVYSNYSTTQSIPSVQGDSAAGQADNKVYVTATDITMKQKNISNKKTSVKF